MLTGNKKIASLCPMQVVPVVVGERVSTAAGISGSARGSCRRAILAIRAAELERRMLGAGKSIAIVRR